ncbi:amidohydrolase family protein [Parvularcula lutaonensis]|uniref:Amidohydrolase family protein n=1 Tax=Parvularcula lutaonensis TaxID=491923 RepID=A0ABV7MCL4_9PROT|nr:amidohydrolase family protein [Parvularcula lutaonensis]GGY50917.1 amidohydrolase [Parvularcula lutaonensis]
MNRISAALLGISALALAACDGVEWHIFQGDDEGAAGPEKVASQKTADVEDETEEVPASPARKPALGEAEGTFALTGARLLTMAGDPIARGTILIEDGRISAVGADLDIPRGMPVIDAGGLTIIPGLVDMHVHHFGEAEGPLYIANGVTTVRNLWGTVQTVSLDRGAADGDYPGPRVYTPGPLTDGPEPVWGDQSLVVTSPEMMRGAVRAQKAAGFTAVKLYETMTPEIYRAGVAEAKAQGMKIYTHTPRAMTVEEVIALEVDSLEHLEDVHNALLPDGYEGGDGRRDYLQRWAAADEDKMRDLARKFAEKGVANSATLEVSINRYRDMMDTERFFESEQGAYVAKGIRDWWQGSADRSRPWLTPELVNAARDKQLRFVKILHDEGAPVLIGTDTPNPFIVQGFSLHDEMASFRDAGFTEEEILDIATRKAAAFLDASEEFGQIREGLRADLVIVEGDPLADLSVLRKPAGVIAGGRLYDRAALDDMLAEARAAAENSYVETVDEETPTEE